MTPLFSRHALTREQAEEKLGRKLEGDPSYGERAVLEALTVLDFERVRTLLVGRDIGDDFRQLMQERLEAAQRRGDKHFVVSVMVSGNAFDHYARQARLMGIDVSGTVAAAVERDFAQVRVQAATDAEPATVLLARYVRELIELLKGGEGDAEMGARLATLQTLTHELRSRATEAPGSGGTS